MLLIVTGIICYQKRNSIDLIFSSTTQINNDFQAKIANDRLYVLDEELGRIICTDLAGNENYEINAYADEKDYFTYADDFCVDENGYVYVLEGRWLDMHIDREAILVYDNKGQYVRTIADTYYDDTQYVNKHKMMGISVYGSQLQYVTLEDNSIRFHTVSDLQTGEETQSPKDIAYTDAFNRIGDAVIQHDTQLVYVLDRDGTIREIAGDGPATVYSVAEDGSNPHGVPYRFCIGEEGAFYYSNLKNRTIQRVNTGEQDSTAVVTDTDAVAVNGVFTANGTASTLIICDPDKVTLYQDGNVVGTLSILNKSTLEIAEQVLQVVPFVLVILYLLILIIRLFFIRRGRKLSALIKIELAVVMIVLSSSGIIAGKLIIEFQNLYRTRIEDDLEIAAYTVVNELDSEDLTQVVNASDYMNPAYKRIMDTMDKNLDYGLEFYQKIYCNILLMDKTTDTAYAIAYRDGSIGTYYPVDEVETNEVKEVYRTGNSVWNSGKEDITGSYLYIKVPVYDEDKNVVGVVAVGTETTIIQDALSNILISNLFTLAIMLLVIWILFGEVVPYVFKKYKYKAEGTDNKKEIPFHVVRILVFLIFAAYNMTASFLPVYVLQNTNVTFGMSRAFVASVPITINLFFIGVMSLFCASILKKIGFRKLTMLSSALSLCGNLLIFVYPSYATIVTGLLIDGIRVGIVTNSVYILIASIGDEHDRMEGFTVYNGGCLAGINFGMIFGAALATVFSRHNVFMFVVVLWVIVAVLLYKMGTSLAGFASPADEKDEQKTTGSTRQFLSHKGIWGFFALIQNPYIITNSFVFYYVPIFCDEHGYNDAVVSLLFMMYSLFAIYMGNNMTNLLYGKFKDRAMYIGCAISFGALIVFAVTQSFLGIVITLILLGVSNSFGKAIQQIYYTGKDEVKKYGEDNAMGIYNFAENIGESAGPMVFSELMVSQFLMRNLSIFSCALLGAAGLHFITQKKSRKNINENRGA